MSLGLAIAGGGLKCVAYIGAIRALEELGIRIDYLSGTSSGSLIAIMYALGYTTEEMKSLILKYYKDITEIPKKPIISAGLKYLTKKEIQIDGLVSGQKIEKLVEQAAKEKGKKNIEEIEIPLAIASVDTITTKEVIFLSKKYEIENEDIDYITDISIGRAIRASMAFPGIFTTCQYGRYNFIDGGTKDNLPVHILKEMGAEKTLALSFKLDEYDAKDKNVLEILLRTVDIFSLKDVRKAQKESDMYIEIEASQASLLTFDDIDESIKIGYETIMNNKNEILKIVD
ncbi:MAG: hypothetical protein HFJ48_00655 [Clostridia bacterium]|nr:hypothetical protein [Clostridia bacterium]